MPNLPDAINARKSWSNGWPPQSRDSVRRAPGCTRRRGHHSRRRQSALAPRTDQLSVRHRRRWGPPWLSRCGHFPGSHRHSAYRSVVLASCRTPPASRQREMTRQCRGGRASWFLFPLATNQRLRMALEIVRERAQCLSSPADLTQRLARVHLQRRIPVEGALGCTERLARLSQCRTCLGRHLRVKPVDELIRTLQHLMHVGANLFEGDLLQLPCEAGD